MVACFWSLWVLDVLRWVKGCVLIWLRTLALNFAQLMLSVEFMYGIACAQLRRVDNEEVHNIVPSGNFKGCVCSWLHLGSWKKGHLTLMLSKGRLLRHECLLYYSNSYLLDYALPHNLPSYIDFLLNQFTFINLFY